MNTNNIRIWFRFVAHEKIDMKKKNRICTKRRERNEIWIKSKIHSFICDVKRTCASAYNIFTTIYEHSKLTSFLFIHTHTNWEWARSTTNDRRWTNTTILWKFKDLWHSLSVRYVWMRADDGRWLLLFISILFGFLQNAVESVWDERKKCDLQWISCRALNAQPFFSSSLSGRIKLFVTQNIMNGDGGGRNIFSQDQNLYETSPCVSPKYWIFFPIFFLLLFVCGW